MFDTIILDKQLLYELSGYPYEPVIVLDCLTNPNYSFKICGEEFFPNINNIDEWLSFAIYINGRIVLNKYKVSYSSYIPKSNQMVVFKKSFDNWYICISDERNVLDISGAFSKNTIIYILADKNKKAYFQKYKYNDFEKEKYINVHYRNLLDIKNNSLIRLFSYKNKKYEIFDEKDCLGLRSLDNDDTRYIYGLNIDNQLTVSALNGKSYNIDELFLILTQMFDDNTTNCIPYLY